MTRRCPYTRVAGQQPWTGLDYGKPVYTIGSRKTGRAVRVALREDLARPTGPDGKTDKDKYIEQLLNDPLESLYRISEPENEFPAEVIESLNNSASSRSR